MDRHLPIGIFDSGVGGLTVYRALHERLPDERFVYLGDTARVPYGTKSLATVERYAVENARFLQAHGIKLLVVACNTASALALPAISAAVRCPVIGVIEPGARAAAHLAGKMGKRRRIGVIATEATIKSGAYSRAIKQLAPKAEVIERACPLFVPLAEEGWADTYVARMVAAEHLRDLRYGRVDSLVLGCTHYPILRRAIQETVGAEVRLIDSGQATAESAADLLVAEGIARARDSAQELAGAGSEGDSSNVTNVAARERHLGDDLDHFYVTDAAERFARVAERFLGSAPAVLEAVEVWGKDELRAH